MSKEAIARVLGAEEEANAIRERARAEARGRLEACEADCRRENAEAVERATHEMKARLAAVKARSEELLEQSREEIQNDIEAVQVAAAGKMREAVKHIEWELCDV